GAGRPAPRDRGPHARGHREAARPEPVRRRRATSRRAGAARRGERRQELVGNPSHPVARVYAAALMEIGRGSGQLSAIYDDLMAVARLYDSDAWFRQFFTSPRIDRTIKWKAVEKAF